MESPYDRAYSVSSAYTCTAAASASAVADYRRADYGLAGAFLAAILAGAAPMVNLPHRSGRTKF